jgi:hypothetical protein
MASDAAYENWDQDRYLTPCCELPVDDCRCPLSYQSAAADAAADYDGLPEAKFTGWFGLTPGSRDTIIKDYLS